MTLNKIIRVLVLVMVAFALALTACPAQAALKKNTAAATTIALKSEQDIRLAARDGSLQRNSDGSFTLVLKCRAIATEKVILTIAKNGHVVDVNSAIKAKTKVTVALKDETTVATPVTTSTVSVSATSVAATEPTVCTSQDLAGGEYLEQYGCYLFVATRDMIVPANMTIIDRSLAQALPTGALVRVGTSLKVFLKTQAGQPVTVEKQETVKQQKIEAQPVKADTTAQVVINNTSALELSSFTGGKQTNTDQIDTAAKMSLIGDFFTRSGGRLSGRPMTAVRIGDNVIAQEYNLKTRQTRDLRVGDIVRPDPAGNVILQLVFLRGDHSLRYGDVSPAVSCQTETANDQEFVTNFTGVEEKKFADCTSTVAPLVPEIGTFSKTLLGTCARDVAWVDDSRCTLGEVTTKFKLAPGTIALLGNNIIPAGKTVPAKAKNVTVCFGAQIAADVTATSQLNLAAQK